MDEYGDIPYRYVNYPYNIQKYAHHVSVTRNEAKTSPTWVQSKYDTTKRPIEGAPGYID